MKSKNFLKCVSIAIMSLALCTMSCKKDDPEPPATNDNGGNNNGGNNNGGGGEESFVIGQSYQGGIIAYIDNTGKHGLIAAAADQSTGIRWYNGTFLTIETGTAIGKGQDNTKRIVQYQGNGDYAAKICNDLTLNGYKDWYLPSKDELNCLYKNRFEIGGFDYSDIYWSSSEGVFGDQYVWCQKFSDGVQHDNYDKDESYRVRAVRSF